MKLYWSTKHNFGDSLNPWLWDRLLPGVLNDDSSELLVGIGTILNHKIPKAGHKHVFGSGYGYGAIPNVHGQDWTIHCVRGPRTAAMLNIPRTLAITDPAILVRRFVSDTGDASGRTIFIPHFESLDLGDWSTACELAGITMVDPCGAVEDVMRSIKSARLVIAEAMHGAIVADALRVPWIPVRPLAKKNQQKWLDWFESVGVSCRPESLPPSTVEEAVNAKYSLLKEAAKSALYRNKFTSLLTDQTPVDQAQISNESANSPKSSLISKLRTSFDQIIPAANRVLTPALREQIKDGFTHRAAEALTRIAGSEPQLSSDRTIEDLTQRLEEKVARLRRHLSVDAYSAECAVSSNCFASGRI
jgi:succinoglycan biosynthesis protein ExoV